MAKHTTAFVAILDALGADHYSREQVERFLKSRDAVAEGVKKSAEKSLKYFKLDRLGRFVFQDTLILTYLTDGDDDLKALHAFGHVLRFFQWQSLLHDILLRGAFSHGKVFKIDEGTNTVMGPVVSDAAAWHQRAEWVGVHATPSTSILLRKIEEAQSESMRFLFVNHNIPFKKGQEPLELKAINWPKGMYLSAGRDYRKARAQLLGVLARIGVPYGSEMKHFNTIEFFDKIAKDPLHSDEKGAAAPHS